MHTTFNLLGPLTNPANAPRQIIGVWHPSLLEPVAHTLAALGTQRAWVVHGEDGLDEITTGGETMVAEVRDESVRTFTITPADFDLTTNYHLEQLRGGNARTNAELIRAVFHAEHSRRVSAARDLIIANAAAAIFVGGLENDLRRASERAAESIRSGAARKKLEALRTRTNPPKS